MKFDILTDMQWNPFLNAFGASAYVWGIGLLISHLSRLHHDTPDNLVGSVSALSLLVFSAAVMGFLFFYRPVAFLIENKAREAISFFLQTLAVFGAITFLVILTIF